jgi:hypothetical protein
MCVRVGSSSFLCVVIEKVAVYVRRRPHDKLIFAHSLAVLIEFVQASLVRPPAKTRKQSEQANFLAVRLIVLRPPFCLYAFALMHQWQTGGPSGVGGGKSKQSTTSMNHCLPTAGIIICTHTKRYRDQQPFAKSLLLESCRFLMRISLPTKQINNLWSALIFFSCSSEISFYAVRFV